MKYIRHRRQKNEPATQLCFFCQKRFSRKVLTQEHIFGQWLIDKCNLQEAKITLVDGREVLYRRMTVPACAKCNNEFGSRFENEIKEIVENFKKYRRSLVTNSFSVSVISGFNDSPQAKLTVWLQKLLVGLLYYEAYLPHARPGTLVPSKRALKGTGMFQHMCRSILSGSAIHLPASLFVFEFDCSGIEGFDFLTAIGPLCIGLKIDGLFFFLAVSDGQLTNNYLNGSGLRRLRKDVKDRKFGPLSYLMAHSYALATRINLPKSPSFVTTGNQIMNMSMMGLSGPRPLNVQSVNADANKLFRAFTEPRGYVFND